MCARPVPDRHAQPDWIGGGSESKQMQHSASADEDIEQNRTKTESAGKAVCFSLYVTGADDSASNQLLLYELVTAAVNCFCFGV